MAKGLFQDFNPFTNIPANQKGPSLNNKVSRGSLIAFSYPVSLAKEPYMIHDPYPMVIITDVWANVLRGVNLHYLTFPYIKQILQSHCSNTGFSYGAIKSDKYIANAFRIYYRKGMKQVKTMDCEWLIKVLGVVRSFSESELSKLQEQIQAQIQAKLQAKAEELNTYEEFRNNLMKSQQRALDTKVSGIQNAVQGGFDRGLINQNTPSTAEN